MTIGRKIIGGYAIVLALLVLVTGVAFYSLEKTRATYDRFIDVNERLVDGANELHFELNDQVAHYRAILLYPDMQKKYWDELQNDHRQFAESIDKIRRLMPSAEGLSMVNEIVAIQAQNEQGQERVVNLAQQNKRTEALALGIKEVRPLNEALVDKAERFREWDMKLEAAGRAEDSQEWGHGGDTRDSFQGSVFSFQFRKEFPPVERRDRSKGGKLSQDIIQNKWESCNSLMFEAGRKL